MKRLLHSNTGFTMLETVAATAMLVMAIMISGSAYSYLGGRSQKIDQKRGINTLNTALNRSLAGDLIRMWRGLGPSGCDPDSAGATNFNFLNFGGTEFQADLLDATRLDAVLINAAPGNALLTAVNAMAAAYGAEADPGARCSDATVLANPQYTIIASSELNGALCRCSLAKTAYNTKFPKLDGTAISPKTGFFACTLVQPSGLASSSQTRNTLNQGPLIVESVVAGVNIETSMAIACSGVSVAVNDPIQRMKTVFRFDYVMHWNRLNGGANQLPLKIAGNLVLE